MVIVVQSASRINAALLNTIEELCTSVFSELSPGLGTAQADTRQHQRMCDPKNKRQEVMSMSVRGEPFVLIVYAAGCCPASEEAGVLLQTS